MSRYIIKVTLSVREYKSINAKTSYNLVPRKYIYCIVLISQHSNRELVALINSDSSCGASSQTSILTCCTPIDFPTDTPAYTNPMDHGEIM